MCVPCHPSCEIANGDPEAFENLKCQMEEAIELSAPLFVNMYCTYIPMMMQGPHWIWCCGCLRTRFDTTMGVGVRGGRCNPSYWDGGI